MQKNGKVRGSHGIFDWKSRDSPSRKSVSSTGGKMDLPKSPCKLINKNKKRFFFFFLNTGKSIVVGKNIIVKYVSIKRAQHIYLINKTSKFSFNTI